MQFQITITWYKYIGEGNKNLKILDMTMLVLYPICIYFSTLGVPITPALTLIAATVKGLKVL
jgi:hypothetical protein